MVRSLVQRIVELCKDERRMQAGVMRVLWILGSAGFICLAAHIKVYRPDNPVPFTFQLAMVIGVAALLGSLDGMIAVGTYLGLGLLGVPVFADPTCAAGPIYFAGPTGGYLVGLLPAALIVGLVAERTTRFWPLIGALTAATILVHITGVAHFMHVMNVPLGKAVETASLPFITFDLIKAGFVYLGFLKAHEYLNKPVQRATEEDI